MSPVRNPPGIESTLFAERFLNPAFVLALAIMIVAQVRLFSLGALALTDNTEARYASISWRMHQTGDWITPRVAMNGQIVPFWAKPPLFFWLTALSFEAFGGSESSARLPNFLIACSIVAGTITFGRRIWGTRVGLLAGLILASSGLFFLLSGTCVLDMALCGSICLAMIGFALFVVDEAHSLWWGRLFFAALGLGCLAKGPVAVALVGLGIAGWILLERRWHVVLRLPWLSGVLIASAIAVPWYLMAERASPGFLRYFLVNEHLLRYIRSDYGDLYGDGRSEPLGASWMMLAVTSLPWSLVPIRYVIDRWRGKRITGDQPHDPWLTYAICWGLAPALFFTACPQILVTYVLPGFPGLALLAAVLLVRWLDSADTRSLLTGFLALGYVLAFLLIVAVGAAIAFHVPLLALLGTLLSTAAAVVLTWWGHRRGDVVILAAAVGIGSATLVCAALFDAAPWINEGFSTKVILAQIDRSPTGKSRSVLFPLNDEYSADFYQSARYGGRIEQHSARGQDYLDRLIGEPGPEGPYVFRRKDWNALAAETRDRLQPFTETPHWIAARKRSTPREASRDGKPADSSRL